MNPGEIAFLDRCRGVWEELFEAPGLPRGDQLDDLYRWCRAQGWDEGQIDRQPQALALGAALGDMLAARCGTPWVWAEGEGLAFLALRMPGQQAVIWPFGMIARRLADGADTTFEGIIGGVEAALADLGRGAS